MEDVNIVNNRVQPKTKEELKRYINDVEQIEKSGYPIGDWDVSLITDMSNLFNTYDIKDKYNFSHFNKDISKWNVENVTDMSEMFLGCAKFNQPLNDWNVEKVTNMKKMFLYCFVFNKPLNNWKVDNVSNMGFMFYECIRFNQPLNDWKVNKVTDMLYMFKFCNRFNQPLNDWNVGNVTDMFKMFEGCSDFNQPLNDWNVGNVTDMGGMFHECNIFNQPLNDWNVGNVTDMGGMFHRCGRFNQPLNDWNVGNVVNMSHIFYNCWRFDQPVLWKNLNIKLLTNPKHMKHMFDEDDLRFSVRREYHHFDVGLGLLYKDIKARIKYIEIYHRKAYETQLDEIKVKSRRPTNTPHLKAHDKLNSFENLVSNPEIANTIGEFIGSDRETIQEKRGRTALGGRRKTAEKKRRYKGTRRNKK